MQRAPEVNIEEVCVVGAGLAGLAAIAALVEEARKNPHKAYKITVIEKRSLDKEDLKRRQKLIDYPENIIPASEKEIDWYTFLKQLFDPHDQLRLNEKGRLVDADNQILEEDKLNKGQRLFIKLMRQPEEVTPKIFKNFSIKDLQEALLEYLGFYDKDKKEKNKNIPDNIDIKWRDKTTIQSVDIENKKFHVIGQSPEKEIDIHTVLLCEGSNREVTSLVKKEIQKPEPHSTPFEFAPFAHQPPLYHCAVRLKLKKGRYASYQMVLAAERIRIDFAWKQTQEKFKQLGWNPKKSDEFPFYVVDSNVYMHKAYTEDKQPRVFVASEIPESLYNMEDKNEQRKKIIQWAIAIASFRYGIPQEYFEFDDTGEDKLHQLNATTFTSHIEHVKDPVVTMPNSIQFVGIGDAMMDSLYFAGISAKMALQQAITTGKCIATAPPGSKNRFKPLVDQYHQHEQVLSSQLEAYASSKENSSAYGDLYQSLTTQLFDAVENGHIDDVKTLLAQGINPNLEREEDTFLSIAIKNGHAEIVRTLWEAGGDLKRAILFLPTERIEPTPPVQTDEYKEYLSLLDATPQFFMSPNRLDNNQIEAYYDYVLFQKKFSFFIGTFFGDAHPKLIVLYDLLAIKKSELETEEKLMEWKKLNEKPEKMAEYYKTMGLFINESKKAMKVAKAQDTFLSKSFPNFEKVIEEDGEEIGCLAKDNIYQSNVSEFAQALIDRYIKNGTKNNYVEKLNQVAKRNYVPALIELGRHYSSEKKIDEAFSCFLNAASQGASCAYIELAALLAHHRIGKLNLFHAHLFIDKGNESGDLYFLYAHDALYKTLDESLKRELEKEAESDDLTISIHAKLDLAMTEEYSRISRYENKNLPESKRILELLKSMSKQFHPVALHVSKQEEFLKAVDFILKDALNQLPDKTSSSKFYSQLQALQKFIQRNLIEQVEQRLIEKYNLKEGMKTSLKK